MILAASGMIFQFAVLGGAFAIAGMVFLAAIARCMKNEGNSLATTLQNQSENSNASSPYQFIGVIETQPVDNNQTGGRAIDFGQVAVSWVKNADIFGVLGLSCFFVFLAFSNIISGSSENDIQLRAEDVLANLVIFGILLLITVALVYRRIRPIAWLGLHWKHSKLTLFAPVVVIGVWIIFGVLQYVGYLEWMERMSGGSSKQEAVKMLLENKDEFAVWLMAISAVIMAPLVEEVIFRGYIYPAMKRWIGIVPAVLFSSLVFAAGHGNAALILPLFLLGGILALAYEFTGSIWMPMAIHAFFNGVTVAVQLIFRYGEIPQNMQSP